VSKVCQDEEELLEILDCQDLKGLLVHQVHQGQMAKIITLKVMQENQDLLDHQVWRVIVAYLVCKDY
jgi:hypothetical protein